MNQTQVLRQKMWLSACIWQLLTTCLICVGLLMYADAQSASAQTGDITIVKELVDNSDNDALGIDFGFKVSGTASATFDLDVDSNSSLPDTHVLSSMAAGEYTIVETGGRIEDADGLPIVLTGVDCGSASITFAPDGESAFAPNATHPANVLHYGHSGVILQHDGVTDVTCTFTNTHHDELPHGGIEVKKECSDGNSTNDDYFFSTATAAGTTNSFVVRGCGSSRGMDFLAPGTHTITENPPTGWKLVDISCEGGGTVPSDFDYDLTNNSVAIALTDGKDPTCTFTNDRVTAVTLASLNATSRANGTTVSWTTAAEIDNAGFNIYGGPTAQGPWTKLNAILVPAEGGLAESANYSLIDESNSAFYILEDVDTNGVITHHGPVSVGGGATDASTDQFLLFLPLLYQPF